MLTLEEVGVLADAKRAYYRRTGERVRVTVEVVPFGNETGYYPVCYFPDRPRGRRTLFYWDPPLSKESEEE